MNRQNLETHRSSRLSACCQSCPGVRPCEWNQSANNSKTIFLYRSSCHATRPGEIHHFQQMESSQIRLIDNNIETCTIYISTLEIWKLPNEMLQNHPSPTVSCLRIRHTCLPLRGPWYQSECLPWLHRMRTKWNPRNAPRLGLLKYPPILNPKIVAFQPSAMRSNSKHQGPWWDG